MRSEVIFLGYIIYVDGLRVDSSKVEAVRQWPRPVNITKVRSFQGLASFYGRFIPHFSSIMAPLTDCMKGGIFKWIEGAEAAFQEIKERLTIAPILVLPDFQQPFELHFDALKEVKHWRHYLFHKEFILYTDHEALKHIHSQDKVSARHASWVAYLERFTFVVKHMSRVTNRVVDTLSRRRSILSRMTIEGHPFPEPFSGGAYRRWGAREELGPKMSQAEFARNHAINRSTDFSPFQVVYYVTPRGPLNLLLVLDKTRVHGKAANFIHDLQEIHEAMQNNLEKVAKKNKTSADRRKMHVEFEVGDFVWAVLTNDRFSASDYHKLASRNISPVEVIEKINPNAYWLKLGHIRTVDVFNVEYMIPYAGDSSNDDDLRANSPDHENMRFRLNSIVSGLKQAFLCYLDIFAILGKVYVFHVI
ncbi:hypothetical protein CRG98_023645 [Punica granatum]|uniref:Uncharacterized protein n=1 Tax=Punica granatum TaxID=22663 RepID=A0A2I0JI82_PUNGR|nr:hypothetical protein CRG98_023645 [Punica granatum]